MVQTRMKFHRVEEVEEAPLRLLVLPPAGSFAASFAEDWHQHLTSAHVPIETWSLDWEWASDTNETDSVDLDLWLQKAMGCMSTGFFDKPYVVFGHSLGALTAVALLDHLQSKGLALPMHLFLSGSNPMGGSDIFDSATLQSEEKLVKLLRDWNGTPAGILEVASKRQEVLKKLRNDLKLHNAVSKSLQTKKDTICLDTIGLSVYGGDTDASVPQQGLENWKHLHSTDCSVGFEMEIFQGGHFYLTQESETAFLSSMSSKLESLLARNAIESKTKINDWNAATASYPSDKCLHDLFYEAVKRSPNATAVVYEDKSLTFGELDVQSERLADYLYAAGVRPNTITGIFMDHCLEFVIAYVAALKAGGAYMPLEIVYPPDLLERVMEESKPITILTKQLYRSRLPAWQETLCMDEGWMDGLEKKKIPVMPADRIKTHPDDLAYVVMSSGTTGVPKGICCPHRGAVHSYHWRLTNLPYGENEREACHVFFVWELLRPILGNRTTYVIPDNTIYDPAQVAQYMLDHHITRVLFTPSLLQLVLDTCEEEDLKRQLASLRIVFLCGEVVTMELRQRFMRLLPDCELQNLYSVSECHDVCTVDLAHMNPLDVALTGKYASCGHVMPNVKAYILDDKLEQVTIGVPGELYIGGPCLAIGYLNRPEQTAERFRRDIVRGELVYKTGDRARFLPNGSLELIGRCDFMVKIRGYSVVLGAVESALAQHPLVSTAVVLTEGDEGSDKRLVAYIVPGDWERVPSSAKLRDFLSSRLPHYAIPSVFVQLDALPINNASGKLDRKQIPSVEEAVKLRNESMDATVDAESQPQTATEHKLLDIWVDLLRLKSKAGLHRHKSFFEAGGHSLLSARLVSSIKDTFGVNFTLADVLSGPELEKIAAKIDSKLTHEPEAEENGSQLVLPLEAALDMSIYPAATRKAGYSRYRVEMVGKPPRTLLLTGATGFLGIHVLHELIKSTHVMVYCVARGANGEDVGKRLRQTLQKYKLYKELADHDVEDRIVPLAGDLAQPLLGLGNDTFKMLAMEVDAIIHCGADVNLVKPYASLKSSNVLGTQEVLRLAVTNGLAKTRVKPVHYISTNGVFPSTFPNKVLKETADLTNSWEQLDNGYAQSKWVAESMCREAAQRGLPVSILRPGNMAPSSVTGAWNESDFIYLLLRGCWSAGMVPDRPDWRFDMTPVDFAARAVTHFAAQVPTASLGQTLHMQNPVEPIDGAAFFDELIAAGKEKVENAKSLEKVEYQKWKETILSMADESLEGQRLAAGLDAFEVYLQNDMVFDASIADGLLKHAGIECPSIDDKLLRTYIGKW